MASFAAFLSTAPFHAALAQTAPSLGTAQSFSVLGGTAVTCTTSVVTGDVGVSPGTEFTSTACTITGTTHVNDQAAINAHADFLSAFAALALKQCTQTLTGTLANVTLPPGVYCFDAAATLTGQLTLAGPANGIWIFKIGAALTATGFSVVMANGGEACNVFWRVVDAATMTDSALQGNILAGAAITITRGSLVGRALANAAVTLTDTNIHGSCALMAQKHECDADDDKDKDKDNDHNKNHDKDKDRDHDKDHERDHGERHRS